MRRLKKWHASLIIAACCLGSLPLQAGGDDAWLAMQVEELKSQSQQLRLDVRHLQQELQDLRASIAQQIKEEVAKASAPETAHHPFASLACSSQCNHSCPPDWDEWNR